MRKQTKTTIDRLARKYGFDGRFTEITGTPFEKAVIPISSDEEKERIRKIMARHSSLICFSDSDNGTDCLVVMEVGEFEALGIDYTAMKMDFESWLREKFNAAIN